MKTMKFKRAMLLLTLLVMTLSAVTGGTIAWFTDSVESASNVITSGNLDIEVQYTLNGTDWKNLDGAEGLFGKGLWEPGHTEVVALRIKNVGSLAAKYAANMNIVNETIGKTKDGKDIKLSDILTVQSLTFEDAGVDPLFGFNIAEKSIEEAFKAENGIAYGSAVKFSAGNALEQDEMLLPGITKYLAIKVDMAETVGNEANHDGTNVPKIRFGLNVVATQYTTEEDSFGSDYDADAEYPKPVAVGNLDELKDALTKGGVIQLANDITIDNLIKIPSGVDVTLDMNGKTLNFDRNESYIPYEPLIRPQAGAKLTVTGNGTFDLEDNYDVSALMTLGDLVIENGTFVRTIPDDADEVTPLIGLYASKYSGDASIVINGGYFDGGYYDANAEKPFTETDADSANRGKAADRNVYRTAIKDNISMLINLTKDRIKVYGGTFVGANPAWGDEGCAMPVTPDYLRPWSYYQGMFLEGQVMHDDKIEIPEGYTITEGKTADGRPTYTVNYSK